MSPMEHNPVADHRLLMPNRNFLTEFRMFNKKRRSLASFKNKRSETFTRKIYNRKSDILTVFNELNKNYWHKSIFISLYWDLLKNCPIFAAAVSCYFLSLLSFVLHHFHTILQIFFLELLVFCRSIAYLFEHVVLPQMFNLPFVELQHISYAIYSSLLFQQKGVLGKIPCAYDPSSVILCLKVRVSKANEYFLERMSWEILAQVSHCICSHNTYIIILSWIFNTISPYFLCHKVTQLVSYFHS